MQIDRTEDPYLVDIQALVDWVQSSLQEMTQGKLARALGVNASTIFRWKNGAVTRLYREQIEAIAHYEGKPFDEIGKMLRVKPLVGHKRQQDTSDPNMVYVPLYLGGGQDVPGREKLKSLLKFPRDWMKELFSGQPFEQFEAVKVVGDSMPPLKSGDWVMYNPCDIAIRDGVFVVRIDYEFWVKRLSRLPGGRVRVSSDNPIYPAIELPQKDVEVIGKVVYAGVQYGG